jgi:hypothetical protein
VRPAGPTLMEVVRVLRLRRQKRLQVDPTFFLRDAACGERGPHRGACVHDVAGLKLLNFARVCRASTGG